jgi:hypothetical protein
MNYRLLLTGVSVVFSACGGGGADDQSTTGKNSVADKTGHPELVWYRFTPDSEPQLVQVEVRDGYGFFQGDIGLGRIEELRRNSSAAESASQADKATPLGAVTNSSARFWSKSGIVVVDPSILSTTYFDTVWWPALKLIMTNTKARFTRDKYYYPILKNGGNGQYTDYSRIEIQWALSDVFAGLSSAIGRQNGTQYVTLTPAASSPIVAHELMHAMGSWHEQSRPDRDGYIHVNWENIQPDQQSQYAIHSQDGRSLYWYDYCSVMHYGPSDYDVGGPTFTVLNPYTCTVTTPSGSSIRAYVGQRNGLSDGDFAAVDYVAPTSIANRPFAYAGNNQRLSVPSSQSTANVTFDGTRSYHPSGRRIVSYEWTEVGSSTVLSRASRWTSLVYFGGIEPGITISKEYRLKVVDDAGLSMTDVVVISFVGAIG